MYFFFAMYFNQSLGILSKNIVFLDGEGGKAALDTPRSPQQMADAALVGSDVGRATTSRQQAMDSS